MSSEQIDKVTQMLLSSDNEMVSLGRQVYQGQANSWDYWSIDKRLRRTKSVDAKKRMRILVDLIQLRDGANRQNS